MAKKVSSEPAITPEAKAFLKALWEKLRMSAPSSKTESKQGVVMSASANSQQNTQASQQGSQTVNQSIPVTSTSSPVVPPITPNQGEAGGSNERESLQPNWLRFMHALTGLILAGGAVYYYTHDTPPNRAASDQLWLTNQGKEKDVELAKVKSKPTQATGQSESLPKQSGSVLIGNDGQHLLATGVQFIFSGKGGNSPDAVIAIKQMPDSYTGAFQLFSKGKTSWSPAWSEDPPSYPLAKLLEESISNEGGVYWIQLFSKGKTQFNM